MKKIILTLACAFLLTGCLAPQETQKQEENNTPSNNENNNHNPNENGENSEDGSENSSQNEENDDNGDEEGNNAETDDEPVIVEPVLDTRTKTVTFKDGSFIGQLDQPSTRDNFISYVNGTNDLLSSVSLVGKSESKEMSFDTLVDGEKQSEKHVVWWLGSSAYNGVLTMNFNYEVTAISLSIQSYYKPYIDAYTDPDNPVAYLNVDSTTKMYIDTEENTKDLSCSETEIPEVVSFDKNYEKPTKQITLGTFEPGERVYIHSMQLTYIHE